MAVPADYAADLESILAKRHDNGADFWATPDGRWGRGSPFSTFDCVLHLVELGVRRTDPVLGGAADVILGTWREDGRFRPAPKAAMYPCHTANAARALGRLGYARDRRLKRTFRWLLETRHDDGGWRCNTTKPGRSPVTDASNPGVTLAALDALRFSAEHRDDPRLDAAVGTLLDHWETRRPLGPCAFGIGTLFRQIEFPFLRYNLFFYVHVLSFFPAARRDKRFHEALRELEGKLAGGEMVVENPHRRLGSLAFCRKGGPSRAATRRWREIVRNVSG